MRIKSVSFRNVGPFGPKGIRLEGFTSGLNVVCETNEFGKSSVLKALEMVLFKPFSSADKQIKSLRTANTEAALEGEIAFSCDGKDYCFSKRFLKSKGALLQDNNTGEVLAIDRAAEETLAKLLRSDRFESGPSGLLWVRQGKSMDGIKDNGQIASRLEGELGTLIGGEHARKYLTRLETELAEVLTPRGQEKKSGPLWKIRDGVVAIEGQLKEAKRLRDMTTSIGSELTQVRDEITQLNGEAQKETLSEQIELTRGAMDAARHFADSLALLDAQYAQALATAERATARQNEQISALVSFNEVVVQLAEIQTASQLQTKKLEEGAAKRIELRRDVTDIETRMEAFSRSRAHREKYVRESQRLEALEKDRQYLEALLEQYSLLENEQSRLTDQISELPFITRADVESLRRAMNELRQCERELTGFSTHLYLDITESGKGKVTLDGVALQTGPIVLPGGSSLSLSDMGTLRSDDSGLREANRNLEAAREIHEALLQRLGVNDTAEASDFSDQRLSLETDRKSVTADMARLAPEGRIAIENNFAAREMEVRELAEIVQDNTAEIYVDDENDVLETLRIKRANLEVVEDGLTESRHRLSEFETRQARLHERLRGLNLAEDEAKRTAQVDELAGEKLKADAEVRAFKGQVETLKTQAPDQSWEMLKARLTRLEQVEQHSRDLLETLKTRAAGLQARRDAVFEGVDSDAVVSSLEAQLKTQQDALARQVREKDVRQLLRDTLIETQSRLRAAYTAPVSQELEPLLSRVFPKAQAGLSDGLGVDTVLRDGKVEKIGQLSGGTQEQFAILTRLAYARLLARSGASAPVILDDALVYADDARREAMYDVLGLVSSGDMPIQIVYLSCHAGATARLGGTRITPQPWG